MKRDKMISKESITIVGFGLLFAVMLVSFQLKNHSFLSTISILNMVKTVAPPIAIAALGLTYVIIIGYADISFYMTSCFSAMFMAWLIQGGFHPPLIAIVGGIIAGALWGGLFRAYL